jgi:hypothetical protein
MSTILFAFFAEAKPVLLTLLLIVPYFFMYYVRSSPSFFIFLGANIMLVIWPLFLPVIWNPAAAGVGQHAAAPLSSIIADIPRQSIAPLRLCWFFLLLIFAIRSISVRLRGQQRLDIGYLVFCVGFLTILSLIAGYFGMRMIVALNAIWAFLAIAGYLVYTQSARIDESLQILSVAGKKPVHAIMKFNNNILAIFFIPVILFAAISPWLPLEQAARLLGAVLIAGLRGFFRFIDWLINLFNKEQPAIIDGESMPIQQDFVDLPEASETPAWIALLDLIVRTLMQILIVAGIAAALAYGAYRFYRRFIATRDKGGGFSEDGDTSEYIGPKLAAKPIANAIAGLLNRLAPKTEAEKIRRAYYKKVRRHIRQGAAVAQQDTAREIASKIRPRENIDDLTSLYERARYSK